MIIELTWAEVLLAATTGMHRHVSALRRKLPDKNGHDGAGWNLHIEGACGEMAAAKALGMFWSGSINTFKDGGDIGRSIQVRTRSRLDYDLIVRPDDPLDAVFILVLGMAPKFDVAGWILGGAARREEWLASHGGRPEAWFVPRGALNSDMSLIHEYFDLELAPPRCLALEAMPQCLHEVNT